MQDKAYDPKDIEKKWYDGGRKPDTSMLKRTITKNHATAL